MYAVSKVQGYTSTGEREMRKRRARKEGEEGQRWRRGCGGSTWEGDSWTPVAAQPRSNSRHSGHWSHLHIQGSACCHTQVAQEGRRGVHSWSRLHLSRCSSSRSRRRGVRCRVCDKVPQPFRCAEHRGAGAGCVSSSRARAQSWKTWPAQRGSERAVHREEPGAAPTASPRLPARPGAEEHYRERGSRREVGCST